MVIEEEELERLIQKLTPPTLNWESKQVAVYTFVSKLVMELEQSLKR